MQVKAEQASEFIKRTILQQRKSGYSSFPMSCFVARCFANSLTTLNIYKMGGGEREGKRICSVI